MNDTLENPQAFPVVDRRHHADREEEMIQYFTAIVNRRSEFEAYTLEILRKKICDYYLEGGETRTAPEVDSITRHANDEEISLSDIELDEFNDDLDEDFYDGLANGDATEDMMVSL